MKKYGYFSPLNYCFSLTLCIVLAKMCSDPAFTLVTVNFNNPPSSVELFLLGIFGIKFWMALYSGVTRPEETAPFLTFFCTEAVSQIPPVFH